jgi:hypothetical protein
MAGVNDETIRRWLESGELNGRKYGGLWATTNDDLQHFLANRPEAKKPGRKPGSGSKFTSEKTILRDRVLISDDRVAENRRKMAELQQRVMAQMAMQRGEA